MKPSMSALITTLSFLLLLSFIATKPSFASAEGDVLDVLGDPLVPGQAYGIITPVTGLRPSSGLVPWSPASGDSSTCEYNVKLVISELLPAPNVPVRFTIIPAISTGSTKLEIEFVWTPDCVKSGKWAAAHVSGAITSSRLVIGRPEDYPNSNFLNGFFQIYNFSNSTSDGLYKLVFCPEGSVLNPLGTCYNVGVSSQLLGLADNALPIRFVKDTRFPQNGKSIIRIK